MSGPGSARNSVADYRHHDLAPLRFHPVLRQENPLPRTQQQPSAADGYRKPGRRQHAARMRRHVIRPLQVVTIGRVVIRGHACRDGRLLPVATIRARFVQVSRAVCRQRFSSNGYVWPYSAGRVSIASCRAGKLANRHDRQEPTRSGHSCLCGNPRIVRDSKRDSAQLLANLTEHREERFRVNARCLMSKPKCEMNGLHRVTT